MALKIPPIVLVLITLLSMWGLSQAALFHHVIPGRAALAVVLVAAGAVACVLGIVSFRKAKTTVDPRTPESTSSLVVAGIYHYSRNPMYFGFALLLLAWGVYLSSLLAILVVPVFILYLNEYQIKPEERALEAQFGQDYVDYKKAVRRWI